MQITDPIVVVDDDEDDHYLMKRVCENLQISAEIRFFSDGRSAFDFLKNTKQIPFIILCDVNMPMMGGIELRRRINDDSTLRQRNTPFLFFSSSAMPLMVREAYNLSVQGFFIKEQSLEKMTETLGIIFQYWERCVHPKFSEPAFR